MKKLYFFIAIIMVSTLLGCSNQAEEGKKAIRLVVRSENLKHDEKSGLYSNENYQDPFKLTYEKYKTNMYKVIFYRKSLSSKPVSYCMVNIKTGKIQGHFGMDEDYEKFLSYREPEWAKATKEDLILGNLTLGESFEEIQKKINSKLVNRTQDTMLFEDGTEVHQENNVVSSISVISPKYATPKGVKVGDPISKLHVYGNVFGQDCEYTISVPNTHLFMILESEGNSISKISIFDTSFSENEMKKEISGFKEGEWLVTRLIVKLSDEGWKKSRAVSEYYQKTRLWNDGDAQKYVGMTIKIKEARFISTYTDIKTHYDELFQLRLEDYGVDIRDSRVLNADKDYIIINSNKLLEWREGYIFELQKVKKLE